MIWLRALVYQLVFMVWTTLLGIAFLPLLLGNWRGMMRFGTFWSAGTLWLLRLCVGL